MLSDPDLRDEFVSFALTRPARFGPENYAGDPLVAQYVSWIAPAVPQEVDVYISWQCPPDVTVLDTPAGAALIRSERLDTLLVEYHHLVEALRLFDADLGRDVAQRQVLRWMCELLIGYRQAPLAVRALGLRPELTGLEVNVWNPFRDETLASVPLPERTALQCFSIGHELGHLATQRRENPSLLTPIDGLPVLRHLDYEFRAGLTSQELGNLHDHMAQTIDAGQLLAEIDADLFGLDTVAEYTWRALSCEPEDAVRSALVAVEALSFVYFAKESCRLVTELAAGRIDADRYVALSFRANCEWYARARASLRHAGMTVARLEGRTSAEDLNRNVDRMDALALRRGSQRAVITGAFGTAEEQLLRVVMEQDPGGELESDAHVDATPDLRPELYYILIAFGCSGDVVVEDYLTAAAQPVQRVRPDL